MGVLVVEDDDAIAAALVSGLVREGFAPVRAANAAEALNALPADFVLLDLGLPDRDGIELFQRLRDVSSAPIIMVTARGAEEDRIAGLDLGADDYVVKPFGVRELVARINAVLRRTSTRDEGPANQPLGSLGIDRRTRTITIDGGEIACTPQELLDAVWGANWFGSTKMIDVHVASLRKKT